MFNITNGGRVKKSEQLSGKIPYVTATTENNGIDTYISNPLFTDSNLLTVNFFGNVYYHPYEIGWKDGTYGLKFKDKTLWENKHAYHYFQTLIEKQTINMGSYDKMLTGTMIKELFIELPIINPKEIDQDLIEEYVQAKQHTYVLKKEQEYVEQHSKLSELIGYDEVGI